MINVLKNVEKLMLVLIVINVLQVINHTVLLVFKDVLHILLKKTQFVYHVMIIVEHVKIQLLNVILVRLHLIYNLTKHALKSEIVLKVMLVKTVKNVSQVTLELEVNAILNALQKLMLIKVLAFYVVTNVFGVLIPQKNVSLVIKDSNQTVKINVLKMKIIVHKDIKDLNVMNVNMVFIRMMVDV